MDRFEEMAVFVATVEEGGLAAAARRLNLSAPTVTRAINALERQLGVSLLQRSTRSVTLTPAGQRYLQPCRRVLAEFSEAEEHAAGAHASPSGLLTITAPVMFGQMLIAPLTLEFLQRYPQVAVHALLSDRLLSLSAERVDVALRIGELVDSAMVAVRVGSVRRVVCAAPALLQREGVPQTPADLQRYRTVVAANVTQSAEWRFNDHGQSVAVRLQPALSITSNRAAILAAERGFGLTRVLSYQIAPQIAAGSLQIVLPDYELAALPVHLLYAQGRQAAAKVRAFVEFCAERMRAIPALQ